METRVPPAKDSWDPARYVEGHSFVYELGQTLIDTADVQEGEKLLDVGCGTGQLTAQLAERSANVIGIDVSPAMIHAARSAYPKLTFEVKDALAIEANEAFDVVFSNATLHWVRPPLQAARCMAGALKPGGRLVAEFGGSGNVELIRAAIDQALEELGWGTGVFDNLWFNPTVAEYTEILSEAGLEVIMSRLFQRPTPLEGPDGLRNWLEMFARPHLVDLEPEALSSVLEQAVEIARSELYINQTWYADYVRLQVVAVKPPADEKLRALASAARF